MKPNEDLYRKKFQKEKINERASIVMIFCVFKKRIVRFVNLKRPSNLMINFVWINVKFSSEIWSIKNSSVELWIFNNYSPSKSNGFKVRSIFCKNSHTHKKQFWIEIPKRLKVPTIQNPGNKCKRRGAGLWNTVKITEIVCYQPLVVCDKDGATLKLFARRRCWVGVGESPLPAFETLGVADCEPPPIEAIAKLLLLINPLLLISLPDKREDSSDFCCCADAPKPVDVSPATSNSLYIPKPMNLICAFVWCVDCFVVLCDVMIAYCAILCDCENQEKRNVMWI